MEITKIKKIKKNKKKSIEEKSINSNIQKHNQISICEHTN